MPVLHVLGTCAGWPEPGRACSGYVVEHAGSALVLDVGFGTLPRLLQVVPHLSSILAIGVSHAHPDHLSDLIGLCRAAALTGQQRRWPFVAPSGVRETAAAGDPDDGTRVVDGTLAPEVTRCTAGPFTVTTCPTPHYLPNLAFRVEVAGQVLVYTGDTGPDRGLAEFARGADVLLSECTDRYQQDGSTDDETRRYLMTARDAGRLATAAAAKSLILTHFWPGNDRARSQLEAEAAYDGAVVVAEDGQRLPFG